MALKRLNMFNYFDIDFFLQNIRLTTVSQSVWKDYDTGDIKGTKVEVVIASDKHEYPSNDGEVINNLYEKLTVKIPKTIDVPMNKEVELVEAEASIYGEYRNQLSIIAKDIQVVSK